MPKRRTEGNLELVKAAMRHLDDLHDKYGGLDGIIEELDLPLDETSAHLFVPELEDLILLSSLLHVESGEIEDERVTAIGVGFDFATALGSLKARAFIQGYIAAKMEAGEL